MKVRVEFTVEVDAEAWATEYGVDLSEVREDVKAYFGPECASWLRDRGLTR